MVLHPMVKVRPELAAGMQEVVTAAVQQDGRSIMCGRKKGASRVVSSGFSLWLTGSLPVDKGI